MAGDAAHQRANLPRNGTADNAFRNYFAVSTNTSVCNFGSAGPIQLPFSSSNHTNAVFHWRVSTGIGGSGAGNPWPEVDALPIYIRMVKRGPSIRASISADNVNWSVLSYETCQTTGTPATTANCGDPTTSFGAATTTLEITPAVFDSSATAAWIEIDSFTITVN